MPHSFGLRARTRHLFSRDFRTKGPVKLSTYLVNYKIGDIVDIKANGAIQKGMPHKFYQGKTGVVYNVTKSAVGVIVHKVVGNRYLEKRVNLKVEHVKHSKCREGFVRRVKHNAKLKQDAKEKGVSFIIKRQPVQPRGAHFVSGVKNIPTTVTPVPYEALV
ncbi:60S ribosomal protein L21A [Irineochytrium annulatum]|nr:60S ribosomal protein L21A [Irineochytrium annulatum]